MRIENGITCASILANAVESVPYEKNTHTHTHTYTRIHILNRIAVNDRLKRSRRMKYTCHMTQTTRAERYHFEYNTHTYTNTKMVVKTRSKRINGREQEIWGKKRRRISSTCSFPLSLPSVFI